MECFILRDKSGQVRAEIIRDRIAKTQLVLKCSVSALPRDCRLYLFDANGPGLKLNPQGDDKRWYVECANADGQIIFKLDRNPATDDILDLDAPTGIALRYFAGCPDYFQIILPD